MKLSNSVRAARSSASFAACPLLHVNLATPRVVVAAPATARPALGLGRSAPLRAQSTMVAGVDARTDPLPPAVLDGTPASGAFPIAPEKLIELAKALFKAQSGIQDTGLLSDDFRFEFPVVSLAKEDYLKAVSGFKLLDAFPDMQPHPYDFRVDPYEPNRVWFTVRNTATHTGDLKFFKSAFKATNKVVYGAPECMSYVFNAEGKCTSYTGGYVMDRRVGNTQGLGAMFGILAAIGGPVLKPGSLAYTLLTLQASLSKFFSGLFNMFTFNLFAKM